MPTDESSFSLTSPDSQVILKHGRYILGVDPGLTTGWSLVDMVTGEEHSWLHIEFRRMVDHLLVSHAKEYDIAVIVIEDFALLGGKALAQTGSKFETCQVIGMFKLWAGRTDTPVFMQPPSIKPIAQGFSGVKPKGAHHLSHHIDAFNHAIFWLRKRGMYKTKLEREGL